MAGPMRDASLDASHRAKVADPRTAAKADPNFEYDDNEWDIGIGDLIIDLDADIEKTNEKSGGGAVGVVGTASMSSAGGGGAGGKGGKMAVEHSATVDKGLKMKIKRTKPGTKTSEAKHEIVKPGEQNGGEAADPKGAGKHAAAPVSSAAGGGAGGGSNCSAGGNGAGSKRGSSGHRRDKARDKHGGGGADKKPPGGPEVNGVVRPPPAPATAAPAAPAPAPAAVTAAAPGVAERVAFPVVPGPGPPPPSTPNAPGPPAPPPAVKQEPLFKTPTGSPEEARPASPPPPAPKKIKTEPKEMLDVCVGTSVATITEPDCLGPCEPGTSVTLEGIVWHETEGGVLVVNVTWRGKTYVGTLLDCTRHDWAPPRFCDSPTSDLDARTPKGRGKRGRAAASATPSSDLSNFTETRSSVHSKLRNGGAKGRRGGAGTGSPTPFVPPRPEPSATKRKGRPADDDSPGPGKKRPAPASPPSSPALLECPEPNCSKKYKHINGLKYHQSHAHGSADDDDTKDAASMSENDESNIEAPSPAPSAKSPEKVLEPRKDDTPPVPSSPAASVTPAEPSSQPATPPTPAAVPAPPTPSSDVGSASIGALPSPDPKAVVKPGVLRYGPPVEDFTVFKQALPATTSASTASTTVAAIRPVTVGGSATTQPVAATSQPASAPPHLQTAPAAAGQASMPSSPQPQPLAQIPPVTKPPQFKVKPTAALMPDDKKDRNKLPGHKKKNRKSPADSPHPQPEQPTFGLDQTNREDVQSPAYSDISDDTAPVLESEVGDAKNKLQVADKKDVSQGPSPHSMPHYGMYPFYGQPPYLVPSVQQDGKTKDGDDKLGDGKSGDKDKKDGGNAGEYPQKLIQQHYYPYGYVPAGYPYNIEPSYPMTVMPSEEKSKDPVVKDDKSPSPAEHAKSVPPAASPIQVPNPTKVKTEPGVNMKDKHQIDNHQILKESMEMKNQMSPYVYPRQQQQQDDLRRYYLYSDQQRRKEVQGGPEASPKSSSAPQKSTLPSPSHKHKDKPPEDKKDEKIKQEGVKPTMETQGPPPPPTSSYAFIHHPSYMQTPHYGALPFDPSHPMYRSMLVPGHYGASPYLHPQIPRYPHAPEDLSRPPSGPTKALDLLQHHANQYYSSHKIHELQERALKSPTPKAVAPSASPSSGSVTPVGTGSASSTPQGPPTSGPGGPGIPPPPSKTGEGKEARSPPPQRHVHTHHHTHVGVGLGYPILPGQYPAPYGAAVLASQQAAAVAASVINPYPPK